MTAKRMTFYATEHDQQIIAQIQQLRPYFTFNFAVREGLRLVLRSLQPESPTVQQEGPGGQTQEI